MPIDLDRLARLWGAAERAGLAEVEVDRPGFRARLRRAAPAPAAPPPAPRPAGAASAPDVAAGRLVRAPKVGVFRLGRDRRTGAPWSTGDRVEAGDSLGAVLIMKVPYEVVVDRPGRIAEVLVEDGAGVEYGQPLFRLED